MQMRQTFNQTTSLIYTLYEVTGHQKADLGRMSWCAKGVLEIRQKTSSVLAFKSVIPIESRRDTGAGFRECLGSNSTTVVTLKTCVVATTARPSMRWG